MSLIKGFQVLKQSISYTAENNKSWNDKDAFVRPTIYLTISFIYRGKEYPSEDFSAFVRYKDGKKEGRIDSTPYNWYSETFNKKPYPEGLRKEITLEIEKYVLEHISEEQIESEMRQSIRERFENIRESNLEEIEKLQKAIDALHKQEKNFSSIPFVELKFKLPEGMGFNQCEVFNR